MGFALVGSAGAVSVGASGASVTPAYGQTPTAGNLLVCCVPGFGSATPPATPTGWSVGLAKSGASESSSASIFFLIATGGDAAPTVPAVASSILKAQLLEFSGNAVNPVLDRTGSAGSTGASMTPITSGADVTPGELVVVCVTALYTAASTITFTVASMNNGATATATDSTSGTSTADHDFLGYGITTGNSAADSLSFTLSSTTNETGQLGAIVSFLPALSHFAPGRMPLGV